jgi:hypothetical protein
MGAVNARWVTRAPAPDTHARADTSRCDAQPFPSPLPARPHVEYAQHWVSSRVVMSTGAG